jgi:hypothetical protein
LDWFFHAPTNHSDVFIFSFLWLLVHENRNELMVKKRNNRRIELNLKKVVVTITILRKRFELAQMVVVSCGGGVRRYR